MKNQALFSTKDKSKKLKCCLLQFLFSALRVKVPFHSSVPFNIVGPILFKQSQGVPSSKELIQGGPHNRVLIIRQVIPKLPSNIT